MAFRPRRIISTANLTIFLLLGFSNAVRLIKKPRIELENGHIEQANSNFSVKCLSNSPVRWTVPKVKQENIDTIFETTNEISNSSDYKFARTLYVFNASYHHTGFFICHDANWNGEYFNETEHFAKVYIYISDDEHLSVSNDELISETVTRHDLAILPCRPTSPDVQVDLQRISDDKNVSYDPKTGFSFYANDLTDEDVYICTFTKRNLEQTLYVSLTVVPIVNYIPDPLIEEISGSHTIQGELLLLKCKIKNLGSSYTFTWSTPSGSIDPNHVDKLELRQDADMSYTFQELRINKTKLSDSGIYSCNVNDRQNHNSSAQIAVKIYHSTEHFLNLWEENDARVINEYSGANNLSISVKYEGHPQPELHWLNNRNKIIPLGENSAKYITDVFSSDSATLTINKIAISDFGNYTLVAKNVYEEKRFSVFVNVTGMPDALEIEGDDFHLINVPSKMVCSAAGNPKPTIQWEFKNCLEDSCSYQPIEGRSYKKDDGLQITTISVVEINANQSGYLKCRANNSMGSSEVGRDFFVSDVANGFGVFGLPETIYWDSSRQNAIMAREETLQITCGASIFKYTDAFMWYHDNRLIKTDGRVAFWKENGTNFTNKETLKIRNVAMSDGGRYSCRAFTFNNETVFKNITVMVKEPSHPVINYTNMIKDIKIRVYEPLKLYCNATGLPKPTVDWYHNDKYIKIQSGDHYNNFKLSMNRMEFTDEGEYKCVVANKLGTISKRITVSFTDKPMNYAWLIGVIAVLALFLAICGFCVFKKVMKERKLERELKIAGLANFEKGAIENLNPELGLDDQAELLPYDKKWEFPIEKLKLGKQLGSGAFGVVMRGEAKGIVEEEDVTTVAVKMVKRNAEHTYIRALASELKIMVHLGKHLNVVNLLGACTRNVAKRELLVIVEFCRFGNLHNYLLKHREHYINQVDPKSGSVDYSIGQDILERTYSVSSNRSNPNSPNALQYAALSFSNTGVPTALCDYRENYDVNVSARTQSTTVSMSPNSGEDEMVLSNNSSVQPEWRSNYQGDYKESKVQPICTKDLLTWAFQVGRGMEYLASRKVLHGDLAARNILLADNNVVKICDFGLAKSMYKNDNYKKKGDGPLPIKWMAVESIRDRVFSTQSDVWSFGIVLWEFFSLARTPYPGMEADERLYNKLLDGYRMESPEFAPKEVYKMMTDCWKPKPTLRPNFNKLSERIGSLLEDSVRRHYIDLNDPYLMMNTQRLEDGQSDYLAMLSPPSFETISTPHYVNDLPPSDRQMTPGYLCMTPGTIFSPRLLNDADHNNPSIFKFDEDGRQINNKASKTKNSTPGSQETEMLPMLSPNSSVGESDCESPQSGAPPITSFSNPSYHHPPIIGDNKTKFDKTIKEESDSSTAVEFPPDNYINMHQNNKIMSEKKDKMDFNPFEKNIHHYVNSASIDV